MEGMRTRRNLVGIAELIVRIVELVNRFMVTIRDDSGFTLVRVMIRALLGMVFGLDELRNVLGNGVQVFFLQRACTFGAVLTAAGVRLWGVVSLVVMRLYMSST